MLGSDAASSAAQNPGLDESVEPVSPEEEEEVSLQAEDTRNQCLTDRIAEQNLRWASNMGMVEPDHYSEDEEGLERRMFYIG